MDYMAPTPSWALYDAEERGFDPVEERFRRYVFLYFGVWVQPTNLTFVVRSNKNGQLVEEEYKASESGCG